MADKLKAGDRVKWASSQGEITGKVVRKVTGKVKIKGHTAEPTKAEPQFVVESDKTGSAAVHKPAALKKA